MGQKIELQFTNKGQDIPFSAAFYTDDIKDILEYKDRPNYCEIIAVVNGKSLTYSINESQKEFRAKYKPFATHAELDLDAISADYSSGGDL